MSGNEEEALKVLDALAEGRDVGLGGGETECRTDSGRGGCSPLEGSGLEAPTPACASNENNAKSAGPMCGHGQTTINADCVRRTVEQLKSSVNEIARAACTPPRATSAETKILEEIRAVKTQLGDLNRILRTRMANDAADVEDLPQAEGAEDAPANEATDDQTCGAESGGNVAALEHIREKIKAVLDKRDEMTSETVGQMLSPVLEDVEKLLKSLERDQNAASAADQQQQQQQCTAAANITCTSELKKVITCLQKQIKCLKPDAVFPEGATDAMINSTLAILKGILQADSPPSGRLSKIEKNLKSLSSEVSRQGPSTAPISEEIQTIQEMLHKSGEGNANPNNTTSCDQCCADLSATPQINEIIAQIQETIKSTNTGVEFPDCALEESIAFLMEALNQLAQSSSVQAKEVARLLDLVDCLEGEVAKQCPCEANVVRKIHEVQAVLRNQEKGVRGMADCGPSQCRVDQLNDNHCGAALQETPELRDIVEQLQGVIKCLKTNVQFNNCELQANITCIVEHLNTIVQSGCANQKALEKIGRLLQCLEGELCKQVQVASKLVTKVCEVQQMMEGGNACGGSPQDPCSMESCSELCNANQFNSALCGQSLQETPELRNILTQLQNFIKCLKPNAQFNNSDLQSSILCVLEHLKPIIQSYGNDPKVTAKLGNVLQCLEKELCKQGQVASNLVAKVREVQQMLNRNEGCGGSVQPQCSRQSVSDQCGSTLKPTKLLTCLMKHLQNLLLCLKPEIQVPNADLEPTLVFLLDNLKTILQSGCVDPRALEKVPKMLKCLECELCNQGKSGSPLIAKVREIQQILNKNSTTQQCGSDQCAASLQETPELRNIVTQLQSLIKCLKPNVQFNNYDLQSSILCVLEHLKSIVQSGVSDPKVTGKMTSLLQCLERELCKQGQVASSLVAKVREVQQMMNRNDGCGSSVQPQCSKQNGSDQCGANRLAVGRSGSDQCGVPLKPTKLLMCLVKHVQNVVLCLKPDLQVPNAELEPTLVFLLDNLKEVLQSGCVDLQRLEKVPKMLKCLEFEICNQGKGGSALMTKVREIQRILNKEGECGAANRQPAGGQCGNDQSAAALQETPELRNIVTQLQNIIKCLKPGVQFNNCELQSSILCVLEHLKSIIQSGVRDPKVSAKIPSLLQCLGRELCKQGQVATNLVTKVREVQQMMSGGNECGGRPQHQCARQNACDQCGANHAASGQCGQSVQETPELRGSVTQLQAIIKCLNPSIQFNSFELQTTIICVVEHLKIIIQSGCTDPKILERVATVLQCLEHELCKQGQVAANLVAKVLEVQQMLSAGSCGQRSAPLKETPQLCCLVAELKKVIQCLKPEAKFNASDIESLVVCCMGTLANILQTQCVDPRVLANLTNIVRGLESAVCEQGLHQSNVMNAIRQVADILNRLQSQDGALGGEGAFSAYGQETPGESLEEVVGRTVKVMDECIKELEFVLRDFVGPLDEGTCHQGAQASCCNRNNDLVPSACPEEMS